MCSVWTKRDGERRASTDARGWLATRSLNSTPTVLVSVTSAARIDAYLYGGHGDDDEEDEDDVEPALRLLVDEHNDGAGHEH